MRVLAFSAIHGNHRIYRRIITCAKIHRADAVILARDLLGVPPGYASIGDAQLADAEKVAPILSRIACPVIYVMGNDDMVELDAAYPNLHSVHGRRFDHGSYNFVGYRHSLRFMGGVYEKPEEEIAADLEKIKPRMDGRQGRHFNVSNVSSGGRIMRGMLIDLDTLHHQAIDEGPIES